MPLKTIDKLALKELSNVLLALEPEFPEGIRLGRCGTDRELFYLYKDQPHVFFMTGPRDDEIQNTMVVPDEMMALKDNRGAAFKALIRMFVSTLKEAMDGNDSRVR